MARTAIIREAARGRGVVHHPDEERAVRKAVDVRVEAHVGRVGAAVQPATVEREEGEGRQDGRLRPLHEGGAVLAEPGHGVPAEPLLEGRVLFECADQGLGTEVRHRLVLCTARILGRPPREVRVRQTRREAGGGGLPGVPPLPGLPGGGAPTGHPLGTRPHMARRSRS